MELSVRWERRRMCRYQPVVKLAAMDEQIMTVAEAAARIRVGKSTMYKLIAKGVIPSIRITPRLIRIRAGDLDRALNARPRDHELDGLDSRGGAS